MDTKLLMWIAAYIAVATILFNILQYGIRLNLLSSLILSTSMSFLLLGGFASQASIAFFIDNVWSIIVLSILITIVFSLARLAKKICCSTVDTINQQKKWTVIFRIRKG